MLGTADAPGWSVSVLFHSLLAELKVAVTPRGTPATEKLTFPLNPFWPFTLMMLLTLAPPTSMVRPLGDELRVKLGAVLAAHGAASQRNRQAASKVLWQNMRRDSLIPLNALNGGITLLSPPCI